MGADARRLRLCAYRQKEGGGGTVRRLRKKTDATSVLKAVGDVKEKIADGEDPEARECLFLGRTDPAKELYGGTKSKSHVRHILSNTIFSPILSHLCSKIKNFAVKAHRFGEKRVKIKIILPYLFTNSDLSAII